MGLCRTHRKALNPSSGWPLPRSYTTRLRVGVGESISGLHCISSVPVFMVPSVPRAPLRKLGRYAGIDENFLQSIGE